MAKHVFRYIEKAYERSYLIPTYTSGTLLYYAKDCETMVVSDTYHVFTIDWVINGKLNDLYYWSTPAIIENGKECYFTNDRSYRGKITSKDQTVNVFHDNPFFLIFFSKIFDSPIKKRILQFLSYIYFFESLMMAPIDQTYYYVAEFVKNLDIDNRRIQLK